MGEGPFAPLIWLVAIIAIGVLFMRARRRRRHIGSAAAGTIYDWLNEEKRNAVEVIVEEKAAYKDPEDKDGNLPDLENSKQ
jgi:hypothetical protein